MNYSSRDIAESKAAELSKHNHCTFTVYKVHAALYQLINGVDNSRKDNAVAQYSNGKQKF